MSHSVERRLSRRRFLKLAGMAGFGVVATSSDLFAQYGALAPVVVKNPLADYPNRGWEKMYRDIFRTDGTAYRPEEVEYIRGVTGRADR